MHLNCTMAKGLFAAEGFQVVNDKPLPFLWDCHHGDTFVLMVKGLLAEPVSGETTRGTGHPGTGSDAMG